MWQNWAGNQQSSLTASVPRTLDELRRDLQSGNVLRAVGSGHSFTPLIAGADGILDMSGLDERVVLQPFESSAWVNMNVSLRQLSPALGEHGLAFRNLGDINTQTLAGAVSTATHGTGATLPCLSAELLAARFMTVAGDVVETGSHETPGLLEAVQVSLGTIGLLLEAHVSLVPKYNLHRQVRLASVTDTLNGMMQHWEDNRNFEFFYIPHTGKAVEIRHNLTDLTETKPPIDLDNLAVKALRLARSLGRLHPSLRSLLLKLLTLAQSDEDYVGESWKVLCSQRDVRFIEMEYHLPIEVAQDALNEVISRTEAKYPDIFFPIEIRRSAGDRAYLSPFQGEGRISIAIHSVPEEPQEAFFEDIETIFKAAGGRPHWGKLHSLTQNDLVDLYPDFEKFAYIRQTFDPTGRLLSPAVARLLDGTAGA
ncbi:D-arabinono-1,4-lactone oxidase [Phaeobacter sp. NW0010-22]|uniref:D-arabinono-1,4-lactone oxidase n=1 Tax=Phaeobacter sp. NW0010-22 TaxID=3135907 RepID=UPI00310B4A26